MKLTIDWLKEQEACADGVSWFQAQDARDAVAVCEALLADDGPGDGVEWANWLVSRCLSRQGQLRYAIYAAERAEKSAGANATPEGRASIEAAKRVMENDTEENRAAARAAWAAAWAAWAAAWDAWAAAGDAAAAARAARAAALAAGDAAAAMHKTVLNHGLELLTKKQNRRGHERRKTKNTMADRNYNSAYPMGETAGCRC